VIPAVPAVSAIIPLFNQRQFVRAAVESVLAQSSEPREVIIVDDGSTDGSLNTLGILKDQLVVYRQRNKGPAAARNLGVSQARGEIIAFLDADDEWPPDKLQYQVRPFFQDSGIDVVLGQIRWLRGPVSSGGRSRPHGESFYGVQLGSGLFRKTVFDRVGRFDEKLRFSEDHDWFLRAREKGVEIVRIDRDVLYYRMHEQSMTRNESPEGGFGLTRIIKRSLDRRRRTGSSGEGPLQKFCEFKIWEER